MRAVFLDTGAFYALADRRDRWHAPAVQTYEALFVQYRLLTSEYVLVETWSLLRRRLGREVAHRFWTQLRSGFVELLGVEPEDHDRAYALNAAWPELDFSLVDLTSFALLERLGLRTVFTFDRHFRVVRLGRDRNRALEVVPGAVG